MATYNYVISSLVHDNIYSFYTNVSKKYRHTYSLENMFKNINDAFDSIYRIENGLMRRKPTMSRWADYFMASEGKWYFAYRIEGDTIYIEDACHAQNIHEQRELDLTNFSPLLFMKRLNKIKKMCGIERPHLFFKGNRGQQVYSPQLF